MNCGTETVIQVEELPRTVYINNLSGNGGDALNTFKFKGNSYQLTGIIQYS